MGLLDRTPPGDRARGASTASRRMARQVTGHLRGLVSVAIPDRNRFGMASGWRFSVSIPRPFIRASVALALASVAVVTTSASGQSPAARPDSTAAISEPKPGSAGNRVAAEDPKPADLLREIEAVKTENAAFRELLRKMEEQQKLLLEQVDRLQRRLFGDATTDVATASQPTAPPTAADASVPAATAALTTPQPVTDSAKCCRAAGIRVPRHRTTSVIEMEWSSGNLPKAPRCRSC